MTKARVAAMSACLIGLSGCMVGPKYTRPAPASVPPPAFQEAIPEGWKTAQPDEGRLRGKWWEMFGEPELNAYEEQVAISNQNVLAAEAQFRSARDAVRIARASLFPTIGLAPSFANSQSAGPAGATGGTGTTGTTGSTTGTTVAPTTSGGGARTSFGTSADFSYQVDVWGSIRRTVRASAETAQATAAQLENAKLTYQAELAQDYFQMRSTRSDEDLLRTTVKSYEDFLQLTKNRFDAGVASGGDVAQAETQLYGAQAQLIDLEIARTQFEHAISILTGKAPIANMQSTALSDRVPPKVPLGLPSELLERRPDIAAAERQMAAANEQIGIAQAALYPTLNLNASIGFTALSLVKWPTVFYNLGAPVAATLFDAGRRRAVMAQASDNYDVTVANYRQAVLTAFQQVEDHLAALRVLENEARAEAATVDAAERSLTIATNQYKAGTTSYLQVITNQATELQAKRAQVDLLSRRMTTTVMLIEALGGGWDASSLPTVQTLEHTR